MEVGTQHVFARPKMEVGTQHVFARPKMEVGTQHVFARPKMEVGTQHVFARSKMEVGARQREGFLTTLVDYFPYQPSNAPHFSPERVQVFSSPSAP